jgi:iron donor protein CyaY
VRGEVPNPMNPRPGCAFHPRCPLPTSAAAPSGRHCGLLVELEFPDGSKIVVNKQPPLHEIWLAARNGGFHFKLADGGWRDTRDGVEFFARLSEEASRQGGKTLRFVPA